MTLPQGLRALGHRDFRWFFAGQGVSQLGTWLQMIATSWLVYQLSGSTLLLGAAAFALWFGWSWAVWPWYLVSLGCFVLAGFLVWLAIDRWGATAPPGGQPPDLPRLQSVLVTALAALGVVLIRELQRWRRARRRPVHPVT